MKKLKKGKVIATSLLILLVGFIVGIICLKNYDKYGIEGLESDYSNCGAESRLTEEQYKELFETLTDPEKHYTLRDARNLIKEKYGIEYTPKQVWIITRVKLGLNYRKPYLVYNKAPDNADEKLKKKHQKLT